eukprot:1139496-Pelagomonas_calceolata.AAC.3
MLRWEQNVNLAAHMLCPHPPSGAISRELAHSRRDLAERIEVKAFLGLQEGREGRQRQPTADDSLGATRQCVQEQRLL